MSHRRFLLPRPVWAAIGAASIVLQAILYTRWAADGGYRLAPHPDNEAVFPILTALAVCGVFTAIFIARLVFLARIRAREPRRVALEATLYIGITLALWLEPLLNIAGTVYEYNAHSVGPISSWAPYTPGWRGPPAHHAPHQPLTLWTAWMGGTAAGLFLGDLLIRFRRRHPRMSTARFSVIFVVGSILFTNLQDPLFFGLGITRWTKGPAHFTLWHGSWHQFPLTETICFTVLALELLGFYYWSRTAGTHFMDATPDTRPRLLRHVQPVLAVVGVATTIMLVYITLLVAFGQLATDTDTHLPAFWSTV
ncbi:spirocyclase AveC family protein [Streptomyces spectabilis]|uniref:spirocyclase AveC family protein n=1 Tax=Streptomyces spectabilis TaxID=68270 RepID=UPI0033D2506A